jgi:quinol monooxygenase YgiN
MSADIYWVFELAVKDGQLENLKSVMRELVSGTKAQEPKTLAYQWTLSADTKKCHIFEHYQDSEAAVSHLKGFLQNWATKLLATGDATGFWVYGNPSVEAQAILNDFGAVYMKPIGGFFR